MLLLVPSFGWLEGAGARKDSVVGNLGALGKAIVTNLGGTAAVAYPLGFCIAAIQIAYRYAPSGISTGLTLAAELPTGVVIVRAAYVFVFAVLSSIGLLGIAYLVHPIKWPLPIR